MGDMVEIVAMDDIAVYDLHGGIGDGADMVLGFNGCLISISISPSNGSSARDTQRQQDRPIQDHFIDVIDKATVCEDNDEYEEFVDEVFIAILDAGRPLFRQLTSSQGGQGLSKPLHRYLFPPFFHFRLEAPSSTGSVSVIPITSDETNITYTVGLTSDQGFQEELGICQDLPSYIPEELFTTEVFERGSRSVTAAVHVQGQDMLCKASGEPDRLSGSRTGREIRYLHKIREYFSLGSIRVPQLHGYVHHNDTKQILGLLQQWVPGRRLDDIVTTATPQNKEKWASQVRQTIELLRQHEIIWGNGKPSNVIIDEQKNAWLIDFGGGYTEGWIDEDLAETKEGDEQALKRIIEMLSGGEDMPVSA
ncbi:uncharacterized protein FTJAE_3741 [Fusarium tjaetaba]|uniref:Protein kinase domain-containing protein n=1 Tax=Fusarium tjaetaba TaxID=1567544 RepID=A0A8H5RWT6_9HYPO|nr:uncharacterized protein FTJAE_3741 [Fusarium tjaetaba]KAF5642266.1 hypothetical protein FTJAE_3741 [Fusarium tjaetaba]